MHKMDFADYCVAFCAKAGIALTDAEIERLEEMECEGLNPSAAPDFIRNIRKAKPIHVKP